MTVPEMILHRDMRITADAVNGIPIATETWVSVPLCEWRSDQRTLCGLPVASHVIFNANRPRGQLCIRFRDVPARITVRFESLSGPFPQWDRCEDRWHISRFRIVTEGDDRGALTVIRDKVIRDNTCCVAVDFDITVRALAETIRDGYSYEAACANDVAGFAAYYGKRMAARTPPRD